jgi:DNA ligase-1
MIKKMITEKEGLVASEPKYDGTRLQIHFSKKKKWEEDKDQLALDFKPKGFIRTFTRNLENTTHMFPDLIQAVFTEVKAQEAILDGEAIGYDPKTGKFLPFQETIKRKRKYGIGKKIKEIPLKFFCFDLLFKDGRDLLKDPFSRRRKILENILSSKNKTIVLSPQMVSGSPQKLRRYHDEQRKKGLEGSVVKKWESAYDPGRRGYTWVKFKQEKGKKGGGLADTLDCVVMGYNKGKGKRAEFGLGAFLVGVRKAGNFLTISKIGTGLSDEQWREMYQRCGKVKTSEKPKHYQVAKNLAPDTWCTPKIVVEIEADNITKSPIHTAKYALRFPRLVRFRDDKASHQATTLAEAEKLYRLQG